MGCLPNLRDCICLSLWRLAGLGLRLRIESVPNDLKLAALLNF
jgi:hypothetical protein